MNMKLKNAILAEIMNNVGDFIEDGVIEQPEELSILNSVMKLSEELKNKKYRFNINDISDNLYSILIEEIVEYLK